LSQEAELPVPGARPNRIPSFPDDGSGNGNALSSLAASYHPTNGRGAFLIGGRQRRLPDPAELVARRGRRLTLGGGSERAGGQKDEENQLSPRGAICK
jgi:hypothetical protein